MWHTHFIFPKKIFLVKKFFSCGTRVCRVGAHTLSHYTFFSGSDMVLYLCKISACCVKRKCKSKGGPSLVPENRGPFPCVSYIYIYISWKYNSRCQVLVEIFSETPPFQKTAKNPTFSKESWYEFFQKKFQLFQSSITF